MIAYFNIMKIILNKTLISWGIINSLYCRTRNFIVNYIVFNRKKCYAENFYSNLKVNC